MKKTMKAVAVIAPGEVKIVEDVPIPEVGDYEALLKIVACGFCNGTDFQIINDTLTKYQGKNIYPTILGHEAAGKVVAVGSKVKNIKIGDCFIRPHNDNIGAGYHSTYGNMAEYGLVVDQQTMLEDGYSPEKIPYYNDFLKVPDDFDLVDCGVLLSLLECYSAVKNFGIKDGMDILVYGCGPMGLAMMTLIKTMNVNSLIAVDGMPDRLEMAKKIANVDQTINILVDKIDEVLKVKQFDVILDVVGLSSIIMEASWKLKQGGKVASMGVLKKEDAMINVALLQNNTCLHMLNDPYGRFEVADEVIKLIQAGKINMKDFYSHVVSIDNISEAMELIRSKKALKVILKF